MELSPEHAKMIGQAMFRRMDYFRRLKARMEARGFEQSNPTYQAVNRVIDSMESLNIHLYYATCSPGSIGTRTGRALNSRSNRLV